MSNTELTNALACAQTGETNVIVVDANIQSTSTFNIQNTQQLLITASSNDLTTEISVKTQRIFRIMSSTVRFTSLLFIGSSFGGGLLISDSNVTVTNCQIYPENRFISSEIFGGGFQATNHSSLTLINSTVSNWNVGDGGAIYLSSSQLNVYHSTLSHNKVSGFGGGVFIIANCTTHFGESTLITNNVAEYGGGIYSEGTNIVSIHNLSFSNNSAAEDGGGLYFVNTYSDQSKLELRNVRLEGNHGDSYSGAVYVSGTVVDLEDVACMENFASVAGGCIGVFRLGVVHATRLTANRNILGDGIPTSIGGALFISTGGELTCLDCSFDSNFAGQGGVVGNLGGNLSFIGSSFNLNTAFDGGVLYQTSGRSDFSDCIFQDNSGDTNGGVFFAERAILNVNNSNFQRNILKSSNDNRGGILFSANSTCIISNIIVTESHAAVGGAFLCTESSNFYLSNSSLSNIYSTNNGGVFRTEYSSQLWLSGVTFTDCSTEGNGGIMNIQASTIVTIADCSFSNSFSGGLGGILYVTTNSQLLISDSEFRSGEARDSGGCIGANGALVTLVRGSLSNCRSTSGGAIYLQASKLLSDETVFSENYADQGGSILGDSNTEITLDSVKFLNNSARYKGGTILVTGGKLVTTHSLFNNSHSQYGGAIHASVGARIFLFSSQLTHNSASYDGGAVVLQSGEESYFNGTRFEHNRANTGAALYLTNSQAEIWKSEFIANEAFEAAGALALYQDSSMSISKSIFKRNQGYLGGVFYIDFSTLSIDSSTFISNSADSSVLLGLDPGFSFDFYSIANGYGAIFYSFLGIVQMKSCVCERNFAYVGGVGWAQLTIVISEGNTYTSNQAYNGGVYSISEHNLVNSTDDIFTTNRADLEGSICHGANFGALVFSSSQFHGHNLTVYTASMALTEGSVSFNGCWINSTGYLILGRVYLQMYSSTVSNIYTITGGAVQILSQSVSIIENTTFSSNFGEVSGGAISYKNTYSNIISGCLFEDNYATIGGGIEATTASINISKSLFLSNKAREAGGGLFWTESAIVLSNNTFQDNSATYGPNYATSPKALIITNPLDFLQPQNSGFELTSGVKIVVIDNYNQQIHLTEYLDSFPRSSIVVAQTIDAYSSISGVTIHTLDVIQGHTIFDNLTVTLRPLTNVTLEFSIQGSSRIDSAFLNIYFRDCLSGEIQTAISSTQTICSQCKEGYYSFDSTDPTCLPCPDHADCPGGNVMDVQPGYWRQCQTCHEIKQCKTSKACLGGTNTSIQCADGYQGPLCDVCSDGFFRSGREECVSCGAGTSYIEVIFAILLLVLIICIFMFWKKKEWLQERFESLAEKVDEALEKYELKAYLTKMKILIGFLQILVNIPEVLAVVFPKSFSLLLNSLNLINLNFFKVFATQCYYNENFYTDLLLSTILPPCLIFVIDLALRMKYQIALRLNQAQPFYSHKQKNIDRRIIFLVIAFFVFSPVSITIFQTFVCEEFEDHSSYLVADYSVECDTSTHSKYIVYAAFMIFLYPIGIPVYYIYHLARKQEYINPPTSRVVRSNEKNIVSALVIQEKKIELRTANETIQDISFLYDSYLPKCWYFEIIECFRRIALTALPVLFLRSTVIQVVLVLIVSLGFSALYMELRPFVKRSDNAVAIVSQWTLSLTFLGALCLKVDMSEDNLNTTLYIGIILSIMNGFTLFLTIYLVIVVNDEDDATSAGRVKGAGGAADGGERKGKELGANDIKLQDLCYEYDSDDDSEVTPEGGKKYPSVELEKTRLNKAQGGNGTQEIRSLKEYQRRASIKQQLLEQEQHQQMEENGEEKGMESGLKNVEGSGHSEQSKAQRRASIRRNSLGLNGSIPSGVSNTRRDSTRKQSIHGERAVGANRPSEVEDIEIFRYSRSLASTSSDSATSNPIHTQRNDSKRLPIKRTSIASEVDPPPTRSPSILGYFFQPSPQALNTEMTNKVTQDSTEQAAPPPRHRIESTPDSDDEM
jgi:predicted outer membrane repeat protein